MTIPGVPVPFFPHFTDKLTMSTNVTKQGVFWCQLFLTLRISLLCPQISALGLAQDKNDDQQFWEREIPCSQWEGSACIHAGLFFPFGSGVGWAELFFVFFSCSECIPQGFSSSQSVLTCIPQDVPSSTWVLSHIVCPKFNSYV